MLQAPPPLHRLHKKRCEWTSSSLQPRPVMAIGWRRSQLLLLCQPALVTPLFDKGCNTTGKMTPLYTVYTKPRWWACVWVCLFFRPYPELPYLLRPSLCWPSFSSSSLSGQTSSWPFCRHGGSVLLSHHAAVNTPSQNHLTAAKHTDAGDSLRSLLSYNVKIIRITFHLFSTWTNTLIIRSEFGI